MQRFFELLKQAHRDEQGAEGLEKILIIAAIVLPLLGVLIFFRDEIQGWLQDEAGQIQDERNAGDGPMPEL